MYCLPAGILVSVMMVLARMHNDSEIVALQAAGVSRFRIIVPLVILGLLSAVASFVIGEQIAPQSRQLSSQLLLLAIDKTSRPFPGRMLVECKDEKENVRSFLMLGKGAERSIKGFLHFDLTQKEKVPVLWAETAEWNRGNWLLSNGRIFELLGPTDASVKCSFGKMTLPGTTSSFRKSIESGTNDDLSMTTSRLREEITKYRLAHHRDDPYLLLQYYRRYAHPANCLLLVLAAFPIALLRRRENVGFAFLYCGVLTGGYFVLQALSLAVGESGRLDPLICAWMPGVLLCSVGLCIAACKRI